MKLACLVLGVFVGNPCIAAPPSWFPLGDDIHRASDRIEAQEKVLDFKSEPRWYPGFSVLVTKAQYELWKAGRESLEVEGDETAEREYHIPTNPDIPDNPTDLPTESQGASLRLAIEPTDDASGLIFALSIQAKERAVRREVEHRRTNVVPFLFALIADGKAVSSDVRAGVGEGGSNKLIELVSNKTEKKWRLRVATKSLDALIPVGTKELVIVASFSERQHLGLGGLDLLGEVWNIEKEIPQILIRSNEVTLIRTGKGWKVAK